MFFDTLFVVFLFALETFSLLNEDGKCLEKYLQPLDVGRNLTYDNFIDDDFICARDCTKYPDPRICYYKLVAEQYHAMGPACKNCPLNRTDCFSPQCVIADGIERTVMTFNRFLDGPRINVCYGDRVIVDVQNKLPARELTVHWHGELMQKTPWMDGVPYVTQCPIADNNWFRYDFCAATPGSHFYHSHSGFQLFEGLSGAFIIRTSNKVDLLRNHYDYDLFSHTIHIQDWMHVLMDDKFPGANRNKTMITVKPDTYLINGMGGYMNPVTLKWTGTPFAEFHVKPNNKKYRFRIISVTSTTCSFQFTIEGHPMTLIATDGYPIKPQQVRTLYMSGGDVYDVVITANQTPRPYWMRVQGVDGECTAAFQQGILKYEGSSESLPPTPNTEALFNSLPFIPELNNIRKKCRNNSDNLCLDELQSLYKAQEKLLGTPYERYIFHIGAHSFSPEELYLSNTYHKHYLPFSGPNVTPLGGMFADTLNNKTNIFPPFALINDPNNPMIDKIKCPEKCDPWCECMHFIKLPYNEVFEMIFIDDLSGDLLKMDHPFHIHGHHFTVMKYGTKEDLSRTDAFDINPNNEYPLIKDTLPIPAAGFAVMRFIADNPGFWTLHCHFQNHNMVGMVIILQVGEPNQMPPIPADWPKCGNYLPPIH